MMIMMRMTRMRKRVEVEVGWRLEARSVRSGQGGQRAGGLSTDGLGQDHHRGAAHYHLQKDPDRSPWWPASLSCPNRHHLCLQAPCQALTRTHYLTRPGFFSQTRREVKKKTTCHSLALAHHHHRIRLLVPGYIFDGGIHHGVGTL